MRSIYPLSLLLLTLSACTSEKATEIKNPEPVLIKVNLLQDSTGSRVDTYALTSFSPDQDSIESRKIIDLKANLLNAIEAQDSVFLAQHLHPSFSYVSGQAFYSKQDFIDLRLYEGFDVKNFKLDSPTIQILNGTAVLSYVQLATASTEAAKSFWTDIYQMDQNQWKLIAIQKL